MALQQLIEVNEWRRSEWRNARLAKCGSQRLPAIFSDFFSSHRTLAILGICLIAALVLMLWARPLAGEQDRSTHRIAAVEEIAATGEAVRVAAANVSISGRAESVAAAGANVRVDANVVKDAWLAGAEVTLDGSVGNTIRVAGSRVVLNARAGGSVWAAGADVVIGGGVAGDVWVAGKMVVIGPDSRIAGELSAAGASVVIDGRTSSRVDVAGALVTFNGHTDGSLSVAAAAWSSGPTRSSAVILSCSTQPRLRFRRVRPSAEQPAANCRPSGGIRLVASAAGRPAARTVRLRIVRSRNGDPRRTRAHADRAR